MIISPPTISQANGEVCVSARIEFQHAKLDLPETLWVSFPEDHAPLVSERADGFVVSLVLLAMAIGEDIDVKGVLSPHLLYGLQTYQQAFCSLFPKMFKPVVIRCKQQMAPLSKGGAHAVACAFSGGVDSFFTLWSHLPENQPLLEFRLTHGVFVHGFDILLEDEATFRACQEAYDALFRSLGMRLLTARTNVRRFLNRVDWPLAYGAALLAIPLVLGRGVRRFYVPADAPYVVSQPAGSDPRVAHLLSTETLEVLHHGAGTSRVDKIKILAQWPATYERLRVCWVKPDRLNNCCRCRKCLFVMAALEVFGALARYHTFPLPLEGRRLRQWNWSTVIEYTPALFEFRRHVVRRLIHHARQAGRRDLAFDLLCSLVQSWVLLQANRVQVAIKSFKRKRARARRSSSTTQ